MDRADWGKVGAAVTSAVTLIVAADWFAAQVVKPIYPEQRGYAVEGVPPVDLASLQRGWPRGFGDPGDPSALKGYMQHIDKAIVPASAVPLVAAAPIAPADLGTLLANAAPDRGRNFAKVCASCHTFEPNGPNRVGPALWAVVGRPVGQHGGFNYSQAMASRGGQWTYEELDKYLTSPARAMPGNKMSFGGIRNPRDRANVLAYLGSLDATPSPYPAAKPLALPNEATAAIRQSSR